MPPRVRCIHPEIGFEGQPYVKRATDGSVRHLPDYIRGKGSSVINNSSRTARVYQKDNYLRPARVRRGRRRRHRRLAFLPAQRHHPLPEEQHHTQRCVRRRGSRARVGRPERVGVADRTRRVDLRMRPAGGVAAQRGGDQQDRRWRRGRCAGRGCARAVRAVRGLYPACQPARSAGAPVPGRPGAAKAIGSPGCPGPCAAGVS
ncbi:peptidase inhibitor family I36 protein [Streptomyces sp. NPDC001674]|uniref:peptidase inhibitor family I36 protein n=1 Tax=Streptomyces sp. NPDC001674 TaxID=3154394 RepID=UPI00331856A8